jgi:hypothetical protein
LYDVALLVRQRLQTTQRVARQHLLIGGRADVVVAEPHLGREGPVGQRVAYLLTPTHDVPGSVLTPPIRDLLANPTRETTFAGSCRSSSRNAL